MDEIIFILVGMEATLFQEDQLGSSYDWQEEQNQQTVYKTPNVKDLFPVNYEQQRDIFFEKEGEYCPHFIYRAIVAPENLPVHSEHQQLAHKILVNNHFEAPKVQNLKKQEIVKEIEQYLDSIGLKDYVEIKFLSECLSRASVAFYKSKIVLKIRTPCEYNAINLEGVLNHEIGTHVVRSLNHKENCLRKPTLKGKIIEEGLASINQLLPEERPFLFKAALRYTSAIYASKMNFSDLYKHVNKYVRDKEDCWRECVRVKRGLGNTDEKGGYYKDQNYLIGAVEILKNRKEIDFKRIYYGKLTPDETKHLQNGVIPPFIDSEDKFKHYLKKLEAIALCNFID